MSIGLVTFVSLLIGLPFEQAPLPTTLDMDTLRAVVVQHDGRYPPLDTVARDLVESVTGNPTHQGHDPVNLLLAWTFQPEVWMRQPLIKIRNAELRSVLQLSPSQTVYAYAELLGHQHLMGLIDGLGDIPQGRKMDPLESKVSGINEKLMTLQQVFQGQALRFIPNPSDAGAPWRPVFVAGDRGSTELAEVHPPGTGIQSEWATLRAAYIAGDSAAFAGAAESFARAVRDMPAAYRPDQHLTATELHYNRLQPFALAWMFMAGGAALSALSLFVRKSRPSRLAGWFDALAVVALLGGFAVLSYGLWLRWQIAGRIPASNMYESLLFLGWGVGAFAIIAMIVQRQRLVPLTASALGATALLLADVLPVDAFIRPIPPVLMDTVWMAIHVPIIMVSYSVLALAVFIAHIQLFLMVIAPGRREAIRAIDSLHYWYVTIGAFLLLAGIMTGSMWAASSWGRYWGWDPKEVWSLVAFLGYLAILHVRIDRERIPRWAYVVAGALTVGLFALIIPQMGPVTAWKLLAFVATAAVMALFVLTRGEFTTVVKSILAFWLIIMTYVGVNYVLGTGLHSYGFGRGGVASRMFLYGGVDIASVALCGIVYYLRSGLPRGGARTFRSGTPFARVDPTAR